MKKLILIQSLLFILLCGCTPKGASQVKKLKVWAPLDKTISSFTSSLGETELYKALEKKTGVTVEFIHPQEGQEDSSLKLMFASGQLPDIIEYNWIDFPGGPSKALNDGYILELNDYISKYAKNLDSYLKQRPDIDKLVKTDDGSYYVFPSIHDSEELTVYYGPAIRKDYLQQLGLQIPTTIDEWTNVLRQLKTVKGVKYPLSYEKDCEISMSKVGFFSAYRINNFFYLENGKVKFGFIEPAYKAYLMKLHEWYAEGLLDPHISVNDSSVVDTKIISGESAAVLTNAGNGIGKYYSATDGKNFDMVAAPYPTLNKSDKPFIGQQDYAYSPSYSAAITPKCKDIKTAVEWLDFGYSEEGHQLFNFGIQNVTYTKEGNHFRYTDMILNNPNGTDVNQMLCNYTRATYGGPFVQDPQYIKQYMMWPQQKDALEIWANTDAKEHMIPLLTPITEESEEIARILNNVKVCIEDNIFDFISGQKSFNEYDAFQNQLHKLNIERAIEIEQAALERYVNR